MRLIKAIRRESLTRPPLWIMRQAGRYLPEYQQVRKQAGSFFAVCDTPAYATEVTIQPIDRFHFDASIIFSDILVIPRALGIHVDFKTGEGPQITMMKEIKDVEALKFNPESLTPVFAAIKNVRAKLPDETALYGFCGAPWTLLLYIVDGHPSKDCPIARKWFYEHKELFLKLVDILIESSAEYLVNQIDAGADVVQIFDSWAGLAPTDLFKEVIQTPLYKLCRKVKEQRPETPIVVFARGIHPQRLEKLVVENEGCFDAIGLGQDVDLDWAVKTLQPRICIQGNLDPALLLTTPEIVRKETLKILEKTSKLPGHIFNLGHGILPPTPLDNVQALVDTVFSFKA